MIFSKPQFTFFLIIFLLAASPLQADIICGRILAKNGLKVRTSPSLKGKVIHKFDFGDTFAFYADGHTGFFQAIQDGQETIKGEWLKIILYPKLTSDYEEDAYGYLFFASAYAEEEIGCEHFRHRLYQKDLYMGIRMGDFQRNLSVILMEKMALTS